MTFYQIFKNFVHRRGMKDITITRSKELLDKYCRYMQHYKSKSPNIVILGILPQMLALIYFFSNVFSLNIC